MNNLNNVLVEGKLVKDPSYKTVKPDIPVCSFPIAVNRRYIKKDGSKEFSDDVSYFEITTWRSLADLCNKYLKQGRGIRVLGKLKQDRWTGQDGTKYERIHIVAEHIEFAPLKKQSENSAENKDVIEANNEAKKEEITQNQNEQLTELISKNPDSFIKQDTPAPEPDSTEASF